MWNLDTGKAGPGSLPVHTGQWYGSPYSYQATLAATCGWDPAIRLLSRNRQGVRKAHRTHQVTWQASACLGRTASKLLSASYTPRCHLGLESGKELKAVPGPQYHAQLAPRFARRPASSRRGGDAVAPNGYPRAARVCLLITATAPPSTAGVLPRRQRIASTSWDGLGVWGLCWWEGCFWGGLCVLWEVSFSW